jgi:hypothetical protein
VSRAREQVEQIERGSVADAEAELLAHLADLKRAVASGAGQAPDLPALRNVTATYSPKSSSCGRASSPRATSPTTA